ncbi:histone deacetylase [Sulfurovum sp.]|jgi:acetoin utilization deacetylase AcuC-like enzyme|uniref:histone deacetylase family protein n=1 Tax=Sulfurovum sp. TaxID=1969726 RepID=UPI002A3686CF|nr:histone deacetylase [Sulfurovum sp.]MDY0403545.1 histone deacetylase [Sulfurovum sp.]
MRVAYITDEIYLKHNPGAAHPESSARLIAIDKALEGIKGRLIEVEPPSASEKIIALVHTPKLIEEVKEASANESAIDADTVCSKDSFEAVKKAVGAGIAAVDGVKAGAFGRAFCAVRPPGHHATATNAMGFCLFNNIAITVRYAQSVGYKKVMIIDFDVHHGNGTQDTFWEDDTVFYFSSHQSFAYPGTGAESHIGEEKGKGYTANFLMMPESGDEELLDIYRNDLPPFAAKFKPDLILVSAGYDLHESDPLASLNITTEGIRKMVRTILSLSDVPYIFFLEGGYHLDALGKNVRVTIEEMLR